jgi:ABC-type Na+ transport system ATPase subunit NatA
MPVIEVSGLTKTFRTYKKQPGFGGAIKGLFHRQYEQLIAVNDVSFKIEPGELVGFLGPNGAGKTTTLKMLAGLLYPTGGSARVLGYVPWERADGYRRQFALVLGQKNQLWWDLPARESLELNAKIYGIPADRFERTVAEMSEMLSVRDKLNVSVRELSLGERMKMELIASLLHQPKVLFLDEPTIGLDVVSQKSSGNSFSATTPGKRRPFCSLAITWPTSRRCATGSSSLTAAKSSSMAGWPKSWTVLPIPSSSPFNAKSRTIIRRKTWRATVKSSRKTPAPSSLRSSATASLPSASRCWIICR